MTYNELTDTIMKICPRAAFDSSHYGEIVIYTGFMKTTEGLIVDYVYPGEEPDAPTGVSYTYDKFLEKIQKICPRPHLWVDDNEHLLLYTGYNRASNLSDLILSEENSSEE